jgi:hypothetical protein
VAAGTQYVVYIRITLGNTEIFNSNTAFTSSGFNTLTNGDGVKVLDYNTTANPVEIVVPGTPPTTETSATALKGIAFTTLP